MNRRVVVLKIGEIIREADTLIPNALSENEKISWLNAVNHEFFSVVKIPKIYRFNAIAGESVYVLRPDVLAKNIDVVHVGLTQYRSMMTEDVIPTNNFWIFDDHSKRLTITPSPYKKTLGIVRYHQIATTTYTSSNVENSEPDAPIEYHWAYVLGLCSRIAKAVDDIAKANNYENDYRDYLNVAAANHRQGDQNED